MLKKKKKAMQVKEKPKQKIVSKNEKDIQYLCFCENEERQDNEAGHQGME